jgi:glycosyltransferase involved in cell wall biosynthesis
MTPKITFIHSLNNFTGSPKVLAILIRAFVAHGYTVELITSKGKGFLSDIPGVSYRYTCYAWSKSTLITAVLLVLSQIQVFFIVLGRAKKHRVFYINTIIPFGAAWACFFKKATYVYHVHENMQQDKPLYRWLRWTYKMTNTKSIFVSHYLKDTALACKDGVVVYNALDNTFINEARRVNETSVKRHTVLMVSSLRAFKGVYDFLDLARALPDYKFELVLSVTETERDDFMNESPIPSNLEVFGLQEELHLFYQRAKLLLVLSDPSQWIETFGMTILEGMVHGVPAIVPPIGGPTELVKDGVNGYLLHVQDLEGIKEKITLLFEDEMLWQQFSEAALDRADQFKPAHMFNTIETYCVA